MVLPRYFGNGYKVPRSGPALCGEAVRCVPARTRSSRLFDNFTPQALRAVVLAQREARQLGHREIGTGHLLLGLALEGKGTAALTLASLQAAPEEIRRLVAEAAGPGPERAMTACRSRPGHNAPPCT